MMLSTSLLRGRSAPAAFLRSALLLSLFWTSVTPKLTFAQSETDQPPPKLVPVLVFNIASTERSLNDISNMFQVAGRPDMIEVIEGFLGSKAGDLKGLDRSRPVGYMLFLEPTLPPRPRMVVYLPVADETELINTLRLGPAPITEVGEHTYEIENRGRRGKTPLIVRGDYAFMLPAGEGFLKDEEFPDPEKVAGPLASRYDLSISIRLRGIPPLIREVFSTFITQQFSAQMQQRDNERSEAFEARRAQGMSSMQYLQQLIRDGEEITVGVDATESGRRAVVEITTDAKPDSEFAKYLTGIAGRQSYFTPLLNTAHPLQFSVSWMMDKRETEAALGYLKAFRLFLKRELSETSEATVDGLVDALEATVKQHHIDAVIQFLKRPGNHLVLVGGVKVVGSESVGQSFRDILAIIKEREDGHNIELDMHQFQGVSLSKIQVRRQDPKMIEIYGRAPDLLLGTGPGVLWFGFGGDDTLKVLDESIDVATTAPPRAETATTAPFQAILHASAWLKYVDEDDLNSPQGQVVQESLGPDNDSLRIEVVPTETGARLSLRFDEGFIHLVGALLAQLYDSTQL
ncbi:hypothetical protein SH661x_001885 [Planctomicrobium sp. SH661]|uniref:hypothetical protein n=1 Tax=Planctomicrobium sp. SH661 TaxID=3448124 RepID=UPI003F5C4E05